MTRAELWSETDIRPGQPLCERLSAETLLQRLERLRPAKTLHRTIPLASQTLEPPAITHELRRSTNRVPASKGRRQFAWYANLLPT